MKSELEVTLVGMRDGWYDRICWYDSIYWCVVRAVGGGRRGSPLNNELEVAIVPICAAGGSWVRVVGEGCSGESSVGASRGITWGVK